MKSGAGRVVFGVGLLAGAGCSAVLGIDADRYLAALATPADAAADGASEAAPDSASDRPAAATEEVTRPRSPRGAA